MNLETLRYLGEKVDKARQLQEKIKTAKDAASVIKRFRPNSIVISGYFGNGDLQTLYIRLDKTVDVDSAEKIKEAVASVFEEYADNLTKEFEEL